MRRLRLSVPILSIGVGVLVQAAVAVEPAPSLSPEAVVRAQLEALAHNDEPSVDAGIAQVWRFASPGNRAQTGPLTRFAQMIHTGYADMLGHRTASLTEASRRDGRFLQGVTLVDREGRTHHYVFVLSQQRAAPCRGCWLTDGVIGDPGAAKDLTT